MGCTSDIMKCFLNFINTLSAFIAVALLYFGITLRNDAPSTYIIFICSIAGIMLLASIIGCCGICQESLCLTLTYAVIVSIVLIGQILGKVYKIEPSVIEDIAKKGVERTWNEELERPGAMDTTQATYRCCGLTGPNDYNVIKRGGFPKSCYKDQVINATNLFHTGCYKAAQDEFLSVFNYLSTSEWGALAVIAITCLCAFYLVIRFSKQRRRYNY